MKKQILTLAALVLTALAPVKAQTVKFIPQPNFVSEVNASTTDADYPTETILSEDFSLMTKGSETTPDTTALSNYNDRNYPFFDNSLTHTPGWSAIRAYQAGGTVCLGGEDGNGGCINTPIGDYSGELTITLRVKNLASTMGYLFVTFCKGGIEEPMEIVNGQSSFTKTVRRNSNWQEVTFTFKNTYGGDDAFIQINAPYSRLLIDDIKVDNRTSFIAAPILNSATDFTTDGFTASWSRVAKATDYLFTLWKKVPVSDADSVNVTEDFEGIRTNSDGSLDPSSIPSGWEIKLHDTPATYVDGDSGLIGGHTSLRMACSGDTITTPSNGGKIKRHWQINVYKVSCPSSNTSAKIRVEVNDGAKWVSFGSFYVNEGIPDVKPAKVMLDYNFGSTPQFYQVRLIAEEFGDSCELAFDDFEETTLTPTRNDTVYKDLVVADTFKVLTGLDPEGEYAYSAKARNTELGLVSDAPSTIINAQGLATPETEEPANVDDRGSFDAKWNTVPKADSYLVDLYKVYRADKDYDDYEIINEDFSGEYSLGTRTNPTQIYNSNLMLLDDYTDNIDWYGRYIICTQSALGVESRSVTYENGELQSPELSLGHSDSCTITLTCCGDSTTDYLVMSNLAGRAAYLPISNDWTTYTVTMPDCQEKDIIYFYTYNGGRFLIDNFRVTQDVKAGDLIYKKDSETEVDGGNSSTCNFSVEEEDNLLFGYSVIAKYTKEGVTAYSKPSAIRLVNPFGVEGVDAIKKITASETTTGITEYYDLSGRRLNSLEGCHGVFIIKNGDTRRKVVIR